MNEGGDETVRIPLEFDPNTAGLQSAQQAAERFEGTVEQLRARLAQLQQQAVATFNSMAFGQAGAAAGTGFRSYPQMQAALQGQGVPFPEVQTLQARIRSLEQQIAGGGGAGSGGASAGTGTVAPTPSAPSAPGAGGRGRGGATESSFSDRFTERVLRSSSLSTLGAFASGDFTAGGRTLARAFMETLATTRPSRSATRTIATSVASSALASGAGGAEEGAEAGAAGGIASTVVRALTSTPLGAILAGVAGLGALGLGANALRSQARGQEYALQANLGGTAGADMSSVEGGVLGVGHRFLVDPKTALALATQLGGAGVGAGQVNGAESSTLAFSRLTGMDPAQIAQITAALVVQGHATVDQVGAVFQTLREGAARSGQSLTLLVRSLQDFQRATGGATVGVSGAAGLAAVQGLLGPAISAGGLLGPAMAATGTQALSAAGVLGITPDRLEAIQRGGDTAQLFDLMAAAAKRISGGQTDQTRIDAVEAVFQNAGVLNLAGVSPANATDTIRRMMTQGPRAAEDARDAALAASAQQTAVARRHALEEDGARAANDFTAAVTKASLAVQYMTLQIALYGNAIGVPTAGGPPVRTRTGFNAQLGGRGESGAKRPDSLAPPPGGLLVPNTRGQSDTVGAPLLADYEAAAQRYGVPLGLLLTVGARESDFHSSVINRTSGARGQMQFLPSTLDSLRKQQGSPIFGMTQAQAMAAAMDPKQATALGAYYLSSLHMQRGNDWQSALSAYGEGPAYGRSVFTYGQALEQRFSNNPPPVTTVQLQGTLTVHDSRGNRIGTAQIAPQTVHVDPGRQPKGGVKGSGPTPTPPPMPPRGSGGPTPTPTMTPSPSRGH